MPVATSIKYPDFGNALLKAEQIKAFRREPGRYAAERGYKERDLTQRRNALLAERERATTKEQGELSEKFHEEAERAIATIDFNSPNAQGEYNSMIQYFERKYGKEVTGEPLPISQAFQLQPMLREKIMGTEQRTQAGKLRLEEKKQTGRVSLQTQEDVAAMEREKVKSRAKTVNAKGKTIDMYKEIDGKWYESKVPINEKLEKTQAGWGIVRPTFKPETKKTTSETEKRQRAKDVKKAEDVILNPDNKENPRLKTEIDFFNKYSDKPYIYVWKEEVKGRWNDIEAHVEKIDISTPEKIRDADIPREKKIELLKSRFGFE